MNWYQFLFSLNMHVCYEPAIPLPDIQPTGWMFSHNTYPNVKINTIRKRQLLITMFFQKFLAKNPSTIEDPQSSALTAPDVKPSTSSWLYGPGSSKADDPPSNV